MSLRKMAEHSEVVMEPSLLTSQALVEYNDRKSAAHDTSMGYNCAHHSTRSSSEPSVSSNSDGMLAKTLMSDEEAFQLMKLHPAVVTRFDDMITARIRAFVSETKMICHAYFLEGGDILRKELKWDFSKVVKPLEQTQRELRALLDVRGRVLLECQPSFIPVSSDDYHPQESVEQITVKASLIAAEDWYYTGPLTKVTIDVKSPMFKLHMAAPQHGSEVLSHLLVGKHWRNSKNKLRCKAWKLEDVKQMVQVKQEHTILACCPDNLKSLAKAYRHMRLRKLALVDQWARSNEHDRFLLLPAGSHEVEPGKNEMFHKLCNTYDGKKLTIIIFPFREDGGLNINKTCTAVQRRLVFLRYGSSRVASKGSGSANAFVDLEGREVKHEPEDIILPESEATYMVLSKFYDDVNEGDLAEGDQGEVCGGEHHAGSLTGTNLGRERETVGTSHPSKRMKY